jgi:low temperature requirement protein LtrA
MRAMTEQPTAPDRHDDEAAAGRVTWLELFFDLVVVAGLGALTAGLHQEVDHGGVALFVVLYVAIWMTWVSVVLYANIARTQTHVGTVVAVMALIALMAASSPGIYEDRANVFAVAFLAARAIVARRALRTGRLLSGWPLLQFGGLSTVWVVAMFLDAPLKFWLWGAALAVDVVFVALSGGDVSEDRLDRFRERIAKREARLAARGRVSRLPKELVKVAADPEHLLERQGVLVIIVLGESVIQLVHGAAMVEWTTSYLMAVSGGFLILFGLWFLRFSFGTGAAPHHGAYVVRMEHDLPLHLLGTLGIALLAAGLGDVAHDPAHAMSDAIRWVMCGGLALTFASVGVGALLGGASRSWLLVWTAPSVVVPILVGAFGSGLDNAWTCWLLLAPVAWQASYAVRMSRADVPEIS